MPNFWKDLDRCGQSYYDAPNYLRAYYFPYAGASSSDGGQTWSTSTLSGGVPASVQSAVFQHNVFAVHSSYFYTSADGLVWTNLGPTPWYGMSHSAWPACWNGTLWLLSAQPNGGAGEWATSSDGVNWTSGTIPSTPSDPINWGQAYWNGGVFLRGATYPYRATSPNGSTWTLRTSPNAASNGEISTANGLFFERAQNAATSTMRYSSDGITWNAATMPSSKQWSAVAWNGSVYCCAEVSGSAAATSPDGVNWTARTLPRSRQWAAIVAINGRFFLAPSGSTGNYALWSDDGITWGEATLPASSATWRIIGGTGA